ncbi:SDR family oxidoreductase [Pseudomonas saliphila]|uniref:SDR family oxidoreductase n=1 Tax=Pseudomonas saliphila TaxID=2586906 RepID=UPI00123C04B1|nr:SDR family oxidoreductase [Pseudomonas saliphila]
MSTDAVLKGKVAIVLGAAGRENMGQVIARYMADAGAKVVVAGRHADELERIAGSIGGSSAICDITDGQQLAALFDTTIRHYGKVDIAINATGWGLLKPFLETTEEELERMQDLQFKGPFMFLQQAVKSMPSGGSIIQLSSATASIMFENHAAYMGTKAGIDHVVRCVANEYGVQGIRANSISPGLTDTPMTAQAKAVPGLFDAFVKGYPLGRIGTSEDIAAAAVWLASDACFMTGQNLQVNGGLTLRANPMQADINAAVEQAAQNPPQ